MFHKKVALVLLLSCLIINVAAVQNIIEGRHPYDNNDHTTEFMECPIGNTVKVTLVLLRLECHFDHLKLIDGDGEVMFDSRDNFCANDQGRIFYSATSNVTLKFDSDGTVTKLGYRVAWECKACGFHKYTRVKTSQSCDDGANQDCVNVKVVDARGAPTISLKAVAAGSEIQLSSVVSSDGTPLLWTLASNWTFTPITTVLGPLCRPCSNHTHHDDDDDFSDDEGCFLVSDGSLTDSVGVVVQCHSHLSVRDGECKAEGACRDCLSGIAMVAIVFFFLLGLCVCTGLCVWACLKAKREKGFDVEMAARTSKAKRTTVAPPEDEPRVTLTPLPAPAPSTPTPVLPPRAAHTPTSPITALSFSTPTSTPTTPASKDDLISL